MRARKDKTVSPLHGALIRVINDSTKFPKVTEALCVTHDNILYLSVRVHILIVGGLAQPEEWELNLTLDSPEIPGMRECNQL